MKMVMINYNEAIEMEVIEVLEKCALKNWTKIKESYGQGTTSGPHLGTDIWPGRNNILYVACQEEDAHQLLSCVKELRQNLGRQGIKAFVWNLEEISTNQTGQKSIA